MVQLPGIKILVPEALQYKAMEDLAEYAATIRDSMNISNLIKSLVLKIYEHDYGAHEQNDPEEFLQEYMHNRLRNINCCCFASNSTKEESANKT